MKALLAQQSHVAKPASPPVSLSVVAPVSTVGASVEESAEIPVAPPRFRFNFARLPLHPPTSGPTPADLKIGPPGDASEREAERVSDLVSRGSGSLPNLSAPAPSSPSSATVPSVVPEVLRSPGHSIAPATRSLMESRLGYDFSRVRIHSDEQAARSADGLNALAYTAGEHIAFGGGQYSTASESGRRLLAHELVHVVQQSQAGVSVQRAPRTRPDVTPDEMPNEIRDLLDHTQERYNAYVTQLEPYYRANRTQLGIEAGKYVQRDFEAVFGAGVKEVSYTLVESDHRIDLFISDYNLGIELKLSGAAKAEQRRVFFERAWGMKGEAQHTLAYVGPEGWWAGAGDRLPKAKLKALREESALLKSRTVAKVEEAGGDAAKAERAEGKAAGKAGKAERAEGKAAGKAGKAERTEAKAAGKAGGVAGVLGKVVSKGATALGVKDVYDDVKAHNWSGAAKDAFSVVEPELSLAGDFASWGWHKIVGGGSKDDEPPPKPAEQAPQHRPIPGGHYFVVMGDGREIEVDAVTLLNSDWAKPIYPDEKFPGEAAAAWREHRKLRIHRQTEDE